MNELFEKFGETSSHVAVERALAEFRSARPIVISGAYGAILVFSVEGLDAAQASALGTLADDKARLVLPKARLHTLGVDTATAGTFSLPRIDMARIVTLALKTESKADAPVTTADVADEDALELARLALVLPAVLVLPMVEGSAGTDNVLRVEGAAIRQYRQRAAAEVRLVSRAPVPLEGAHETEFVVFRGGEGMRDQVAIIVGKPDMTKPVYVRLHSACLTGDLFGSLKCDCGDQLRATVRWMAEHNGGILLYLDQEGRGNGIANKMRAYQLQAA